MRYTVLQPVKHDGKRVEPGHSLSLPEHQAAPLLSGQFIEADHKDDEKAAAKKAAADKAAPDKAAADKAAVKPNGS